MGMLSQVHGCEGPTNQAQGLPRLSKWAAAPAPRRHQKLQAQPGPVDKKV